MVIKWRKWSYQFKLNHLTNSIEVMELYPHHYISITWIDSILQKRIRSTIRHHDRFLGNAQRLDSLDGLSETEQQLCSRFTFRVCFKTFFFFLLCISFLAIFASVLMFFFCSFEWSRIKCNNECSFNCREPSVSNFIREHHRSVDEVWYKRAVEQHYVEPQSFVYSVPFNQGLHFKWNLSGNIDEFKRLAKW